MIGAFFFVGDVVEDKIRNVSLRIDLKITNSNINPQWFLITSDFYSQFTERFHCGKWEIVAKWSILF